MMDVYLVRHAIAYERNPARWPNDALRPLTTAGKRKFRKAARGLSHRLPKSVRVLTSPFMRARETADILVSVAELGKPVEAAELSSGKPARESFALLRAQRRKAVVMVGHEPNLSTWMSAALDALTTTPSICGHSSARARASTHSLPSSRCA
jgi:phosphohistidine phosphatase